MKNRLAELMQAYRRRPDGEADKSLWQFVAERDPYVFSHHPAGPEFREHVWKIGGLYFCKGCVVTFFGAVFGAGYFAVSRWLYEFTDIEVGLIFCVLLVPTLLLHLWRAPRWFRHASRFLLGFLMASAFLMLFVTDSWLVRAVIAGAYLVAKIPLERKRNRDMRRTHREPHSSGE